MNKKDVFYTGLICILSFLFFSLVTIHILNNESFMNSLYYISESDIHGNGVFASVRINNDSNLGVIVIKGDHNIRMHRRYENDRFFNGKAGIIFKEHRDIGRFINHSDNPNTKIIIGKNSCSLVSTKEINEGEEITTDYRDFRKYYMGGYMADII